MPSMMGAETSVSGPENPFSRLSDITRAVRSSVKPAASVIEKAQTKAGEAVIRMQAKLEEKFLHFCTNLEEKSVRELPPDSLKAHESNMRYSRLDDQEFSATLENPQAHIPENADVEDQFDEKQLETVRVAETVQLVRDNEREAPVIRSVEDSQDPLGDVARAQIYLVSDLHHAMERVGLVREEAFSKYGFIRRFSHKADLKKQQAQFPELSTPAKGGMDSARDSLEKIRDGKKRPDDEELVTMRYVVQENVRNLFHEWAAKLIGRNHAGVKAKTPGADVPIVLSLGDGVHDTGTLLDQIDVERKAYGTLAQVEAETGGLKARLLSLWGNHDQDSRVPESFTRTTEMFGHRVFSQKIDGVLLAAVDTNIINPEWEAQFIKRAGDDATRLLEERKLIQEAVLSRVKDFDGQVLLMGHNPARIIETFSDLIKQSGVTTVIGGHTHSETHMILPYKNGKGEPVTMHVVESVVREKHSDPLAPKLYATRIGEGKVHDMWTLREPEERFTRRYRTLMSDMRADTPEGDDKADLPGWATSADSEIAYGQFDASPSENRSR